MPLRSGSSDKVIQDNIRCLLEKDGCGYDPPYMDPARREYTPPQAAAIAYAKAGKRKAKTETLKGNKQTQSKQKKETADSCEQQGPMIPDGWKTATKQPNNQHSDSYMTNSKDSENFGVKLKPGKPPGAIQWQDINGRPVIKSGVGWKLQKEGDDKYLGVLQKQQKEEADAEKNKPISGKILGLLDNVLQKLSSAGLEGVSGNYQTRSQFTGGMDRNPTTKNSESTEVSVPDGWNIKP